MDEKRDTRRHGVKRHAVVTDRDCGLGAISFQNLVWTEHSAKIVDLSVLGIGIETDHPIEAGIIWFKEQVYGQKCGFLVWCKKKGDRYRTGIQFVTLARAEEEYLHQQISRSLPHEPLQDPDGVIERMLCDIKKDPGRMR